MKSDDTMAGGPALEFDLADLRPERKDQLALERVVLRLDRGELGLVLAEKGRDDLPLADAAEGLLAPVTGRVRIGGDDWAELTYDQAVARRGRIGRVFLKPGWVSNLDVIENVTLAQRHHTGRPVDELAREAQERARRFGLEGVPAGRPAWVPTADLRRAEWVRAFMGDPVLVLLERPMAGVPSAHLDALVAEARDSAGRGAAVLWVTGDPEVWDHRSLSGARRWAVRAGTVVPVGSAT